jgi:hypothetical protein
MKKTPLTNLQTTAYKISLTNSEREAMRARIMSKVHAAPAASPVRGERGLYYFFNPQFAMSFAAFLLVLVTGSATAFAAKGSLPGDALYVVKTKINEPIKGALAFSTEDKIRFHTDIAETRIVEAEVLASENRLDTKAAAELESSLDIALAQRNELAQKFQEEQPDESDKIARLDTTIVAHSDILVQLGAESSSTTTRENSDTLAMKVRSNSSHGNYGSGRATLAMAKATTAPSTENAVVTPMAFSVAAEDTSMAGQATSVSEVPTTSTNSERNSKKVSADSKARTAAATLGKKATTTLESLRAKAASMKEKINKETKEKLNARFEKIESYIEEGNEAMERGDYRDARNSFNEALDREATLSAFITAGVQFNKGILGNLLGNDSRWGHDE